MDKKGNAMVSARCEVADCDNPPRWVVQQEEQISTCLCTEHWQEMRRENPHAAYLYSPLAVVRIRERISAVAVSSDSESANA